MFRSNTIMATKAMLKAPTPLAKQQTMRTFMAMSQPRMQFMMVNRAGFSTALKNKDDEEIKGFARLTKHYKERKAMERAIVDIEEEMTFNHLPYGIRFFMFLNRIKLRIFIICSLVALFNYWGNLLGLASSRIERVFKKYKKRWIYKYNRTAMTYATALETRYEPTKLSRPSTDRLSALFVKIDRELEYGLSRQLLADCLVKMDLMEEAKEVSSFLDKSGHNYIRSKMLNSLPLMEYLQLLEFKFVDESDPSAEIRRTD